jgi:hypothetical protein
MAACLLLLLLAANGLAAASPRAEAYFRVRARAKIARGLDVEAVRTRPDQFAGKLVEVRGSITTMSEKDGIATLLIKTGAALPVLLALPPDKKPADWPFLDVGIGIRALCHVVKAGSDDAGSLEVVIPVKADEAALFERERAAAELNQEIAAAKATLAKPRTRSRPTDQELVLTYGNTLHRLNPPLTASDARFLASRIIDESRKHQLDARFFVAVVVVEGTVHNLLFLDRGTYIGNQAARTALAKTAADLQRRIGQNRSAGALEKQCALALKARRPELSTRLPVTQADVERYVNQVMRFYFMLCGMDE